MVDVWTIAKHEAAHAVMRWLRGWPATELRADSTGGFCAGTGRRVRAEDKLFVTLAGFACESGYGICGEPDLANCHGDDIDKVRRILKDTERLRVIVVDAIPHQSLLSVDEALLSYFIRAEEMLWPHALFIEDLGRWLEAEGNLSAQTVAALFREYRKRLSKETEDGEGAAEDDLPTTAPADGRADRSLTHRSLPGRHQKSSGS